MANVSATLEVFYIDLLAGQALQIEVPPRGGDTSSNAVDSEKISITLESKSGQRARLKVSADRSVTFERAPGTRKPVTT